MGRKSNPAELRIGVVKRYNIECYSGLNKNIYRTLLNKDLNTVKYLTFKLSEYKLRALSWRIVPKSYKPSIFELKYLRYPTNIRIVHTGLGIQIRGGLFMESLKDF